MYYKYLPVAVILTLILAVITDWLTPHVENGLHRIWSWIDRQLSQHHPISTSKTWQEVDSFDVKVR